ncbi:MAG: acyltransferase [Planctomycetes bacterium]|nr:acyltransferase [Planctomycetota bacterium]
MSGGPSPAGAVSKVHLPALDGIRCLGFLLVFAHHAGPQGAPVVGRAFQNMWAGVDVFFTLSGFLVTWLLLREEDRGLASTGTRRFSLVRFWIRRALRIWPLYFAATALFVFALPQLPSAWEVGPTAGSQQHADLVGTYFAPTCAFLMNGAVILHGWPAGPIGPLWSVSAEEQFYVLWPLAMFVVPHAWRRRAIVFTVLAATVAKVWLLAGDYEYQAHYVNTLVRADAFLVGAWIAILWNSDVRIVPPRWLGPALVAAAVALLALPPVATRGVVTGMTGYLLLDGVAAGILVMALDATTPLARVLSTPAAVWMGKISYGLYVFHHGAITLTDRVLEHVGFGHRGGFYFIARGVLALAITLALAVISYHAMEKWFLRLKDRFT